MHAVTRRQLTRAVGSVVGLIGVSGCLGSDGGNDADDGDDAEDDGNQSDDIPKRVRDHLQSAQGYDGELRDRRGEERVQIDVGAGLGGIAFAPAALRVDVDTRIVWRWTGRGGNHDVVSSRSSDFEFESERTREEGHEFEHTAQSVGIALYECRPHRSQGMVGAIEVTPPAADDD